MYLWAGLAQLVYAVYGTKVFSETSLFGRLDVVKSTFRTITKDSGDQLIDMTLRDWSIILQQGIITFFKKGTTTRPNHASDDFK